MSDYIVRATAADANIRAFAVTSREMVETAREDHMTTPVMTAALGRLLSAGAMMGAMMKGDEDYRKLFRYSAADLQRGLPSQQIRTAMSKGFAINPQVRAFATRMRQASSMWVERLIHSEYSQS